MLIPELASLLDPVPGAVNHANAILLDILKIFLADKLFAECAEDHALVLFLFVFDVGEEFEPLHLLACALLAVALLEIHHE